jgi:predicted DNA-binding transcriptional regulator YafY
MDEWHHQRNREFFYTLERLSDAITQKKQVAFRYNKPKEDGALYPVRQNKDIVSPFALVCANGQYYLIACYKNYDDLRHVRVDRMTDVEILEEKARAVTEIPGWQKGLNIGRYAYEHNFMFSGKSERIELRMRRSSAGDVIDAFGSAATMTPIDEVYMKVEIDAAPEGMRYFALQFAPVCEVMAPQNLRDTLRNDAKALAIKYGAIEP